MQTYIDLNERPPFPYLFLAFRFSDQVATLEAGWAFDEPL